MDNEYVPEKLSISFWDYNQKKGVTKFPNEKLKPPYLAYN